MASQSDHFPLEDFPDLPVALTLNPQYGQEQLEATCRAAPVGTECFSFLQLEYECHTTSSSSTVMIFNPDFTFAGTIRTTTHTRTISRSAHIRGKSTSWLEAETPVTPSSTTRLTITTPTGKYDAYVDLDLEVPLSPKSLPAHTHPFFTLGDATTAASGAVDHKGYVAAGGVLVRRDVAAKLSLDRGKPNRRRPLPAHFTAAGLERRRTVGNNAEECCSDSDNKVTVDPAVEDGIPSTERCLGGKSISTDQNLTPPIKMGPSAHINPLASHATVDATNTAPIKSTTKKLRPKLHLRTSLIIAAQRAPTPQLISTSTTTENRNLNRGHNNIPKEHRSTSSPDVSKVLSQPQRRGETETARQTTQTQHRRRTSGSRLPLHTLLLSPLGARRRFSTDSMASNSSSTTTSNTNTTNSLDNNTGTATPASASNYSAGYSGSSSVGRVRGSVFSFRLHEVDEEEEEDTTAIGTGKPPADTADMVPIGQQHLSLGGTSRNKDKERPTSRFKRFSLAYLGSGGESDDTASETRSPLRGWRSWSSRSSIASIGTSDSNDQGTTTTNSNAVAERVNASRSFARRGSRFSIASLGTSYGSTSSSEKGSTCTASTSISISNTNSGRNSARYSDASVAGDERHRSSLSCSSVAELPWRTVPVQTYAHLMSSRRNSAATANTAVQTQNANSGNIIVTKQGVDEVEDPYTAFCNSTRPKPSTASSWTHTNKATETHEDRAARVRRRAARVKAQIQTGAFYDPSSEDEDEDEKAALQMIAEEGDADDYTFGHSDVHDWWMAGTDNTRNVDSGEDEWRSVGSVPSLEFEDSSNRWSVEVHDPVTPTAPATSMGFTVEGTGGGGGKGRRRRTASSECLIVAAEGLRGLHVGENEGGECAVEE
ncbi:hypothetical protein ABW21_db0204917 [Orbilia brochopaga]|nr:hypothetical protein ABW21_db0204917 [Drechslerella brochopaga]